MDKPITKISTDLNALKLSPKQWELIVSFLHHFDWKIAYALDEISNDDISEDKKDELINVLHRRGLTKYVPGRKDIQYMLTKQGTAEVRSIAGIAVALTPEQHAVGKPAS